MPYCKCNLEGKFQIVVKQSKTCHGGNNDCIYESKEEALKDYELFRWCRTQSK